jgi:hypothetical protein
MVVVRNCMEDKMFQVVVEHPEVQLRDGVLKLVVPQLVGEIRVTQEQAQRAAKGYLTSHVAMAFRPGKPVLVWGERPLWRMEIYLHLRAYGQVASLGHIDVDAMTGTVLPLSSEQISKVQDRANELAARLTPPTDPAS